MRDIEITKREILVSIVIILLMIAIGLFISSGIHNKVTTNNEKYFKSLKVNNDSDLFQHAIATDVGHMVSYGEFIANEPVSDPLIKGKYFSIKKVEEHYVEKTRIVTYTDSNGDTKTRIETYWEWNVIKREQFDTKSFSYLGVEFPFELISFKHHLHNDTIKTSSKVRFKFYTIPESFYASLYSKAESQNISQNKLYPGQGIDSLIQDKEQGADSAVIVFWIVWIILIAIVVVLFISLENSFINNNKTYWRN